jgi:hypothetical protein
VLRLYYSELNALYTLIIQHQFVGDQSHCNFGQVCDSDPAEVGSVPRSESLALRTARVRIVHRSTTKPCHSDRQMVIGSVGLPIQVVLVTDLQDLIWRRKKIIITYWRGL